VPLIVSIEKDPLPPRRGIIFILSAPSGAGKTTISRAALKAIGGLEASVSVTTRAPREGEIEGVDYRFVSADDFKGKLERDELAEWARVFDASYGTPRAPLEAAIAGGRDILLDIDIQGARQIRGHYAPDTVMIFVLPPTFEDLERRLRGRRTETEDAIQHRLHRAREESRAWPEYDYLIINREVDESLEQLESIVKAERRRTTRLPRGSAAWKL
jgi:guanylate kinase